MSDVDGIMSDNEIDDDSSVPDVVTRDSSDDNSSDDKEEDESPKPHDEDTQSLIQMAIVYSRSQDHRLSHFSTILSCGGSGIS